MSNPVASSDLRLRPAVDADRPFLCAVYADSRQPEMRLVPWTDEQKALFLTSQFEAQDRHYRTHYPNAEFNIIVVEGVDAGRLYIHRDPEEIRIMDIALLAPFRNRGCGSRLLEAILAEATQAGARVTLHVEADNPAQRLYARLGFAPQGETGVYQLLEWTPAQSSDTNVRSAEAGTRGA